VTDSFDWPEVDAFVPGAVGPPGRRVFYVQLRRGDEVRTLRAEKQQVAALAQYLDALLADLPTAADPDAPDVPALVEPVQESWAVGTIGLRYDEDDDCVVVEIDELVAEGEEGAEARVRATRPQAEAFARQSAALVQAGRPTCALCGHPVDPEGHVCPRANGQSRPSS
jgi:uncharacterized repeat protein (TIGR03847 family)